MGIYFLGVSLGNLYVSGINVLMEYTKAEDGSTFLDGPAYYYAFSTAMLIATVGFVVFAKRYKGETFIHGEVEESAETAAIQ